ncbi:MAG: sulfatase [Planctomycetaceae bacterium]|jgi:arylsulfatase A|nr:sulfatase [Planctomycetaceae bacterium]
MMTRFLLSTLLTLIAASATYAEQPNFILIYCDNLGYGDIGCFGSTKHKTPHLDKMAEEGLKLTSYYSASGVCTPSRAALMTACYPRRVGLDNPELDGAVLRPVSTNGLNPKEITIAEVLKDAGYVTSIIGKWHLGDQPEFLPTRQGFDSFFGIPYSDDMTPRDGKPWPELPLMENETVIEAPVNRDYLTKRYTERAVDFLKANREKPFFLYMPQAMPGSTRTPYSSPAFQGKSNNGQWGDCVEELDWSTGEILKAVKELDLDDNTLVLWTSDNGAPRRNPVQGSNLPLSGWGYSTAEGGMRVPCIVRWPGKIAPGTVSDELCSTIDMLPTFATLADADFPEDRIIDGKDIRSLLFHPSTAKTPHEAFYYYQLDQLQAVRAGHWKLYLPLDQKREGLRDKTIQTPARLFNLKTDLAEETDVAKDHPGVVKRLLVYAERIRADLGEGENFGPSVRSVGRNENPHPLVLGE